MLLVAKVKDAKVTTRRFLAEVPADGMVVQAYSGSLHSAVARSGCGRDDTR